MMGWTCRIGVVVACLAAAGCGRAPQLGPDAEAFAAVDALYTAVSLRDAAQVARCAATLDRLHAGDRLPGEAREALAGIVAATRRGDWASAREDLRSLMLAQRP